MSKTFTKGQTVTLWNWAGNRMKIKYKITDVIFVNGQELVFFKENGLFNRTFFNSPEIIEEHRVTNDKEQE